MKFLKTWVLLGLAVVFGLYIYFIEIKKTAQDEEKKNTAEKVLSIDTSKVKTVEIKNDHGDFIVEKTGDKTWEMKSPVKDSADESTISSMLSTLGAEKSDQAIEGEALSTFGLDNPKITATFTTQDGKSEKIDVGNEGALPGKIYLERDGDKKVLFSNAVFKVQLDKSLKDFRDKRVFRKNKDDIASVSVRYDTKDNHSTVNLLKKGNDWLVDGVKADGETVEGLLNVIDSLKATDFASEKGDDKGELKKYGLEKPEVVLNVQDKDKKPLSLINISGKKDNKIYVKVAGTPTIYESYGGIFDQLQHKPGDFRDKKGPFEFQKNTVDDITVKTGLVDWHLLKKGNSWELATPNSKKQPDQIQIENFLDLINNLRVSEFPDKEKPLGLNPPQGNIVFKNHDSTVLNLAWGEKTKSGKSLYVKTNKTDQVVAVDASAIQTLPTQSLVADVKPSPSPVAGSVPPGKPALPPAHP